MNNITKQDLRRKKRQQPIRITEETANRWEQMRYEMGVSVINLPVSHPTYRKAITTGSCNQGTFDKLNQFFKL